MREGVRGPWSLSIALSCLVASASAQQDEVASVVGRLRVPEALAVAKAAAAAREIEGREVANALRRALVAWHDGDEASCVRALLLDALIRHDAKLPGDLLLPMLGDARAGDAAFVLLCRSTPANESDLVAAYRATSAELQLRREALGRLLMKARSPLFVEELVRGDTMRLRVVVRDPPQGVRVLLAVAPGSPRPGVVPPGFPELSRYELEATAMPSYRTEAMRIGALLEVAPDICARRMPPVPENDERLVWMTTRQAKVSSEADWLLELSGVRPGSHELVLEATDPNLESNLKRVRDETIEWRQRVLDGLLQAGLISAERSAELAQDDVFFVVDERADQTKPLPSVPQR